MATDEISRQPEGSDATTIAIATLTFARNDYLTELLPRLVAQIDSVPQAAYVLVVDNHPDAIARPLVEQFPPHQVRYAHEPTPGIAAARNRALLEARRDHFLVFIDDDEVPSSNWLKLLLQAQERFSSAAVVGSVERVFAREPGPWIRAGRFFHPDPLPTGTRVPAASTANILFDLKYIRRVGLQFDISLGLSGGSDTLFTRQIVNNGGELVWCAEARVIEFIPPNRISRRWVLTRSFRAGNSDVKTAEALTTSDLHLLRVRAQYLVRGLSRMVLGSVRSSLGTICHSLPWEARGARTVARGAGMVVGAIGYKYDQEYRKTRKRAIET